MRPLLAYQLDSFDQVPLPIIGSVKIDGFRVYKYHGVVYVGRDGKELNNDYARKQLEDWDEDNFDGEMTVVDKPFHKASGELRARSGRPQWKLQLFDSLDILNDPYIERHKQLRAKTLIGGVELLPYTLLETREQLRLFVDKAILAGHEGVCLRWPYSKYKQGRSTLKEFSLAKWKPFVDDEAICIGFEEQLENRNEGVRNEFGLLKRSTHQENMFAKGTMGKIVGTWNGLTIKIGTGFDDEQRNEYWSNQNKYIGKPFTFKYQKHGTDILPRTPVFKCFREIT